MREIRASDYNESCYTCDSINLKLEWIPENDCPGCNGPYSEYCSIEHNNVVVTCMNCGEYWEDSI